LVRQSAYRDMPHRVAGSLENSDFVMNRVFWLGVYPGLDRFRLQHVLDTVHNFVHQLPTVCHALP
jgi:CDP-6-deoxy-D-xylo-4-hexulose-3-dehydrase